MMMVSWTYVIRYHGSEELKEDGRYRMSLELDQKLYHLARLKIDNVAKGDAGEYREIGRAHV